MNLILLSNEDFVGPHLVLLKDRRFVHVKDVLKAKEGQELTVGIVNGSISQGKVIHFGKDSVKIGIQKSKNQPPVPLEVTLIMALPRPPMFRRTLQCATSLGIKKIIILNCSKVEKSLWQSSALRPESIEEDLKLGLEQAKDTRMPEVILEKKFKPFVEDQLPQLIKGKKAIVAHPNVGKGLRPFPTKDHVVVFIGPEGGFTDFEVDLLTSKGVKAVNLGERILRFENVIPYVVGRISS